MNRSLAEIMSALASTEQRRKCFISYYSGDRIEVDAFLRDFGDVFIPKAIGVSDGDDFINSHDTSYVMSKLRDRYLGDSTVTICLIGNCTHSRRYVDWELKTTLRQGTYTPNGLIGIVLPSLGTSSHLPPRFKENWGATGDCYAIYKSYPSTKAELKIWIDDAFQRRTSRTHLISNAQEMLKYNRPCNVHKVTH